MTSSLSIAPYASLRLYNDATDRESVIKLCGNVYEDADYLPLILPRLSTLDSAHGFVLPGASPFSIDAFVYVASVGARYRRGPVYLLGGVRVNPARRGVGVGRKIVELVEEPLLNLGAERVLAATSGNNEPMRRILEGLGWRFLQEIIIWPTEHLVRKMEGSVLENFSNRENETQKAEKHSWEPCRSSGELQEVLKRLANVGGTTLIPSYYKMILTERLEEECKQEKVWIGKKNDQEVGVVASFKDWERFHNVVSVCTRDPDFLESALRFVENNLKLARYIVSWDGALDLERCLTLDFKKCEPERTVIYQKTFPSANT